MAKTQNSRSTGKAKAGKNKKFKKRERKNVPYGLVFIQASFNNTIVTITDGRPATRSAGRARARSASAAPARAHRSRRSRLPSVPPTPLATTVCARSMSASPVPAPAASPPSAHSPPPASTSAPSATSRRCPTTAAVLPSAAASDVDLPPIRRCPTSRSERRCRTPPSSPYLSAAETFCASCAEEMQLSAQIAAGNSGPRRRKA